MRWECKVQMHKTFVHLQNTNIFIFMKSEHLFVPLLTAKQLHFCRFKKAIKRL